MRFSLANLLWLTFWAAILISFPRFVATLNSNRSPQAHFEQNSISYVIMLSIAAVGAIAGRAKTGAAVGVLVAMLVVSCLAMFIYADQN